MNIFADMKQKEQSVIPVHSMDSQIPLAIEFSYWELENESEESVLKSDKNIIHRDDYYLFLFVDTANGLLTLDFNEIQVTGNSVLYIRPGQVHFASSIHEMKGWSMAIDPMLVEKDYKNMFERQFLTQRPIDLNPVVSTRISNTARLLHNTMQATPTVFGNTVILNLANAFIGIIAGEYANLQEGLLHNKSRSALIAHQFKGLLSENFKTIKSPTQYAEILNYSLSHLNESVKMVTGFPVSYWIHQQVVLEAKRLLYYTTMDVKEIAFSLGYDDHTYFSRLFSKVTGISPGAFRHKFHE